MFGLVLQLSGMQLVSVSDNIERLDAVRHLDLSNNCFTAIPPGVLRLRTLTTLLVAHNQLTSLSACASTQLEWLAAHNNQIESIDPSVAQLHSLVRLQLHNNRIAALPPALAQLARLLELSLYGNANLARLSDVPDAQDRSNFFPSLQDLWLDPATACPAILNASVKR